MENKFQPPLKNSGKNPVSHKHFKVLSGIAVTKVAFFFLIFYYHQQSKTGLISLITHTHALYSYTVTSSLLRMADLFEVTELLKIMTKNEMIQLGTALGLSYIRLQKMSIYPEEMVAAWLRQDYQVLKTSGPPSWTSLVTALKRINQSGIAEIIRKGAFLNLV